MLVVLIMLFMLGHMLVLLHMLVHMFLLRLRLRFGMPMFFDVLMQVLW